MSLVKIQQLAATLVESLYDYEKLMREKEQAVTPRQGRAKQKLIEEKKDYLLLLIQRLKKLIEDEQRQARA